MDFSLCKDSLQSWLARVFAWPGRAGETPKQMFATPFRTHGPAKDSRRGVRDCPPSAPPAEFSATADLGQEGHKQFDCSRAREQPAPVGGMHSQRRVAG